MRVKINNLNKEITNNNWEELEITFLPGIVSARQIDMNVSAILKVQSGLKIVVPRKSNYSISEDYNALEEYIVKLITHLKQEIKMSNFNLEHH